MQSKRIFWLLSKDNLSSVSIVTSKHLFSDLIIFQKIRITLFFTYPSAYPHSFLFFFLKKEKGHINHDIAFQYFYFFVLDD